MLPTKIRVDLEATRDNQIPSFGLCDEEARNPIHFLDSKSGDGREYGAIKITLPQAFAPKVRHFHPELYWFHTNKLLINPPRDDLALRLAFYRELSKFIPPNLKAENPHLLLDQPPIIENRPVDMYRLFKLVAVNGGYKLVAQNNLWHQIARELGYKFIDYGLVAALRQAYEILLHPYEIYITGGGKSTPPDIKQEYSDSESHLERASFEPTRADTITPVASFIENATASPVERKLEMKDEMQRSQSAPVEMTKKHEGSQCEKEDDQPAAKRMRLSGAETSKISTVTKAPLILGSSKQFPRLLRLRSTKGYLMNAPHLINLKHPIIMQQLALIQPQTQVHNAIRGMFENKTVQCDDIPLTLTPLTLALYLLAQFVERDHCFQDFLLREFEKLFDNGGIEVARMEDVFWKVAQRDVVLSNPVLAQGGIELEAGHDLPLRVHGLAFATLGDDVIATKLFGSSNTSIEDGLNPWNLHNLGNLPDSLLAGLYEPDLGNPALASPRALVGMTFSVQNWRCQEQFCQLINLQVAGAPKLWYFVAEADFERFEALVQLIQLKDRIHINNNSWDTKNYSNLFVSPQAQGAVNQSIELMINTTAEPRLGSEDAGSVCNQEHFLSPALLHEHGIKFTLIIQRPGEYVVVYPKTYASCVSLGVTVLEEINVATVLWLDYALAGEKWLLKQRLLPNFSTFKLMVNLIQLLDSPGARQFSAEVYTKLAPEFCDMVDRELELRAEVRKLKVKETAVDDKGHHTDVDDVADDTLQYCFPSKIVLNKAKVVLLTSYLKLPVSQAELQVMYLDEKLRQLQRIAQGFLVDFREWKTSYEELMHTQGLASLKTYKQLLMEGERIAAALCPALAIMWGEQMGDPAAYSDFLSAVNNLRQFIHHANEFIEQCQALLAIKHQQRIRNGNDYHRAQLIDLERIVEQIPLLNFSSVETEQVMELKLEIENFDKALRALLAKLRASEVEFNDLINLGELFGVHIPSLAFITRIRDRMHWHKTFGTIEKGGDPYADSKEVFTLDNLEEFLAEGLRILPKKDAHMVRTIQGIVQQSKRFDTAVDQLLDVEYVDDVDVGQLDEFAQRFRLEKLFLHQSTYDRLLQVHDARKLIAKVQSAPEGLSYNDLRALLAQVADSDLKFRTMHLQSEVTTTEDWAAKLDQKLESTHIISTMEADSRDVNVRAVANASLVQKLHQLLNKAEFCFSEVDSYTKSSSYQARNPDDEPPSQPIYCVCREFEFGTMIECDQCTEWYHEVCVQDKASAKNEVFVCDVCKVVNMGDLDDYLKGQITYPELNEVVATVETLKAVPAVDIEALKDLLIYLDKCKADVNARVVEIINSAASLEEKLDQLMFWARKVYGAGVFLNELMQTCIAAYNSVKRQQPILPTTLLSVPPLHLEPVTKVISITNDTPGNVNSEKPPIEPELSSTLPMTQTEVVTQASESALPQSIGSSTPSTLAGPHELPVLQLEAVRTSPTEPETPANATKSTPTSALTKVEETPSK